MLFTAPPWPRDYFLLVPQASPLTFWQVELDVTVFGEDGRDEQIFADKELPVTRSPRGRIMREFKCCGAQAERPAHARAVHGLCIQVGHKAPFKSDECAQHRRRALRPCIVIVNEPGNTIRVRPVQARVGAQQPECHPPLVDPGRRRTLEPANVAGPEAEARQAD